jgi:hypothetical protein
LSILALCSLALCDENKTVSETRIVPVHTRINFPQTHERIIVPIDPVEAVEVLVKPVREPSRETNFRRQPKSVEKVAEVSTVKPRQAKRNPKNYDDGKGNYKNSYSYISRNDNPQHSKDTSTIQPLHINTQGFKRTPPQNNAIKAPTGKYQSRIRAKNPEEIHELKNMVKDSRTKLKVENLPENPAEVPTTSWFDNTGKYYYGIVHGETFKEPEEYKNNQAESPQNAQIIVPVQPPPVFKSSFKGPSANVEHTAQGRNLGNFLYQSEVYYPSYRNNLYPPVVTYGDPSFEAKPATKELPTTVLHKPPPKPVAPRKEEAPQQKKPQNSQKPQSPKKPSRPQKPKESEKQAPAEENDEDYEDEDSGDYEDPGNNDRYDGEAPGNDDEAAGEDDEEEEESDDRDGGKNNDDSDDEEASRKNNDSDDDDDESSEDESEEAPKYRYHYDDDKLRYYSPKHRYRYDVKGRDNSESNESDEFDKSWSKYGYGPKRGRSHSRSDEEESGSYESSETQIAPQRIKFYHEKKEQSTGPMQRPATQAPIVQIKKMTRSMSGALNNTKPKQAPQSVKSQEEKSQPADDLKYFQ